MKKLMVLALAGVMCVVAVTATADAKGRNCRGARATDWTLVVHDSGAVYALGTDGDDVFAAGAIDHPGPFIIVGLDGDDRICASRRDDIIHGGPGNDTIYAEAGADVVSGDAGNDYIQGSWGNDELHGGDGADVISGGSGHDVILGGAGNDSIWAGPGIDTVQGGDGDDAIMHAKRDLVDVGDDPPEPSPPQLDLQLAIPTPTPSTQEPAGDDEAGSSPAPEAPVATATPTPPTVTLRPTPTVTVRPTPTPTARQTPTATARPTPTVTPRPTATATPRPTVPPPTSPSGRQFSVVGRQILDPNGRVFYPIGGNVGPPLRDSAGACVWFLSLRCSDITGRLASVQAWNWNTLRLNLLCDPQENPWGAPYGPKEMFDAVDKVVREYTAAGVVVMLDCHNHIAERPPVGGTVWRDFTAFWDEAIARYGDNPYVWINFANEFHGGSDGIGYWKSFTEAAYNHLRGRGFRGVMVMDLPNWAQHIQFFDDPANVAWSKQFQQVVWDWHAYGGVSEDGTIGGVRRGTSYQDMSRIYDRILANLAANAIPVIVGEFGHDWNDQRRTADGWSYESMVVSARLNIEKLPAAGIGMTVWHANGSSGTVMEYGLKASDDLTFDEPSPSANLSTLGQLYWDLTRRLG